ASEWETFTTPDGSCSVLLPGKPVPLTQNAKGLVIQKYLLLRSKEQAEFGVAYADLPGGLLDLTAAAALERDHLKGLLNAQVVGERDLSLDGHPGREIRLQSK